MENVYQFLREFDRGTRPRKSHLERRYGKEYVKKALEYKWIVETNPDRTGEILCAITNEGIERRDK